jgi:hypothetical protein
MLHGSRPLPKCLEFTNSHYPTLGREKAAVTAGSAEKSLKPVL